MSEETAVSKTFIAGAGYAIAVIIGSVTVVCGLLNISLSILLVSYCLVVPLKSLIVMSGWVDTDLTSLRFNVVSASISIALIACLSLLLN